jgi:DNA-binding protein YbaB
MLGFDQAKEIYKWKKIQDEVKKQQSQIFAAVEKRGIKVVVKGDKKIEKIELDGLENKELKEAINEAMKEVDKKLQKKLQGQAGELGIPTT